MYLPDLKFVALPIPEIIGDTQKIGQSLDTPMLSKISPKFFMGLCSDGPCECIGQI